MGKWLQPCPHCGGEPNDDCHACGGTGEVVDFPAIDRLLAAARRVVAIQAGLDRRGLHDAIADLEITVKEIEGGAP
jgi:hypothetical protein